MVRRAHDPRRLDVAALAAEAATLEGTWPLADLARLCADHPADAPAVAGEVAWRARGERRAVSGGGPEIRLHLHAAATVHRACQRCLQPLAVPLAVDRVLRFVEGESLAAELDADSDDDVLALERTLDLRELVEDELLLALPMVPRHDLCPAAATAADGEVVAAEREHPFAVLAAWRGKPPAQ
jgi:uncharacterized protein